MPINLDEYTGKYNTNANHVFITFLRDCKYNTFLSQCMIVDDMRVFRLYFHLISYGLTKLL